MPEKRDASGPDSEQGQAGPDASSGDLKSKFGSASLGSPRLEKARVRASVRGRMFEQPCEHERLGRFKLLEELGAGGMGVVYAAYDEQRDERVALKTLERLDPHKLYRLTREFRALADLNHPNVVTVYEMFAEDGQTFFTMELVRGVGFLQYTRAGDRKPGCNIERLRLTLRQLVEALTAIHRAGQLHLDIKPGNLLVTKEGRLVLLDFGLAREPRRDALLSTADGLVAGTPAYIAPELLAGESATQASDWYSVGVMLYEALTGEQPFPTTNFHELMRSKLDDDPKPASELGRDLPPDLCRLSERLLRRDPSVRPTGSEILGLLGRSQVPAADVASPAPEAAPFVGRLAHLQALQDAFDASRNAQALTVAVHGTSGVGKTALVWRFLEQLRQREDVVILLGRCYERDLVPYRALDSLVDSLSRYLRRLPDVEAVALVPREIHSLARLFPVLRRAPAVANAPDPAHRVPDAQELRLRAFAALKELLARISDRHPLVLYIDDLHWGDHDSSLELQDLIRAQDAPRLLLIASCRREEVDANPALRWLFPGDGEASPRGVIELRVDPLAAAESEELAAKLMLSHGQRDPELAASIAGESEGNPFFTGELVRHACGGAERSPGAATLSLDDVVMARVGGLASAPRELLEIISVAGAPIEEHVARRAANLDGEYRGAAATLRASHLTRLQVHSREDHRLQLLEPYHDRIREAVVADLAADRKRTIHGALARAIEAGESPDPAALAMHFEGAGEPERASTYAAAAGERAFAALAFDRAAAMYQRAVDLTSERGPKRHRLSVFLGEALANAGQALASVRVYEDAIETASKAEALELRRRIADQLVYSGHVQPGIDALQRSFTEIGISFPATQARAFTSLLWQQLKLRFRGYGWKPRDEADISPQTLTHIDTYATASVGLGIIDTIRSADFQARGLLLALKTGEERRIARLMLYEAIYMANRGGKWMGRAHKLIARVHPIVESRNDPYLEGIEHMSNGALTYFEGDFRGANEKFRAAETLFRERTTGAWRELNATCSFRVFTLRYVDALAELRQVIDGYVRDAERRGDQFAITTFIRHGNIAWLAEDDPEGARRQFDRTSWSPQARDHYHYQHYFGFVAASELDLYEGKIQNAIERWGPEFHAFEDSLIPKISFIAEAEAQALWGRLCLSQADAGVDEASALRIVDWAVRALERKRIGFIDVWAMLLRAGRWGRRDPERAVGILRTAAERADANDQLLYAAIARRRLGELLGGDEGAALVRTADDWMMGAGTNNPERMAALLAPGFG